MLTWCGLVGKDKADAGSKEAGVDHLFSHSVIQIQRDLHQYLNGTFCNNACSYEALRSPRAI